MTNKEAIEVIKNNYPDSKFTMLREALDKAIYALTNDAMRNSNCLHCLYTHSSKDGEYLICVLNNRKINTNYICEHFSEK